MSKPSYSDLLKDPRWQRKRLEILQRDGWECMHCGSGEKTLHVHHRIYRKNTKPWDYENDIYETLCEECHKLHSDLQTELNEQIGQLGFSELNCLLGYAKGMNTYSNGNVNIQVNSAEEAAGVGAAAFSTETAVIRCLEDGVLRWETFGILVQLGRVEEKGYDQRFVEMLTENAAKKKADDR